MVGVGVGKFYGKKPVRKDIYPSYFYGAVIDSPALRNRPEESAMLRTYLFQF